MTRPKNLGAYDDIRQIWDAAILAGGAKFELETQAAAMAWRHRANRFRKLLYDLAEKRYLENGVSVPVTPYDAWMLQILPDEPRTVVIRRRDSATGKLTSLDGKSLKQPSIETDQLETEAFEFAKRLGLDDEETT